MDTNIKPINNYRLGATAYIIDPEEKLLLLVQQNDYMDNQWALPGGGRIKNETPIQNITREIQEELSAKAKDYNIIGISCSKLQYDFPRSMVIARQPIALKYKGQKKYQVLIYANSKEFHIVLDKNELRNYKWVSIDDLNNYMIFPGQYESAINIINEFKVLSSLKTE